MQRARPIYLSILIILLVLTACGEISYYNQSVMGHFEIISQAESIEKILTDEELNNDTRHKLLVIQHARNFATSELQLKVNKSYTEYVHLERDYVLQNLIAAEEFSTQLYSWCYPVIGCANYRGYFDESMLLDDQRSLVEQGYDTYRYEVTAYSTLGWFNDPVLSTFLTASEYRLAGLIFHELAHQQIYIAGDTAFNESFATAVEQAGLEQFYADEKNADQLQRYRDDRELQGDIVELAEQTRSELDALYQQPLSAATKREHKAVIFVQLGQRYAALRQRNAATATTGINTSEFNNARLGVITAYHDYVSAFLNILERHDGDFPSFYSHVEILGDLEQTQREKCLLWWGESQAAASLQAPDACRL